MKAGVSLPIAIFVLACAPAVQGQGAVPVGDELQINSFTTSTQNRPAVAAAADGGFVVVWASDSSNSSIQGQRYGADGTALGAEFQVNSHTDGSQFGPSVATLADGSFVVLWASNGDMRGQRFAPQGTPEGGEFQVNSYTGGSQRGTGVAPLADGGFVAAWHSAGSSGSDSSSLSIQSQRFAADGTPEGGELQVNSYTTGTQFSPSVAALTDGGFIVTWTSSQLDGSNSAHGRRFAADGMPEGGEFQVNSDTVNVDYRGQQAVAPLAAGGFIVTWASFGTDASATSIQARRFAADGTPGGEFQVNSYTFSSQSSPSVATFADGSLVVAWDSYGSNGSDASPFSIQGQRYAVDGSALGGEFQVNSYTTGNQYMPSVATLPDGDFIVAWTSFGSSGSDSSLHSVQGQRFAAPRFSLVGLGGKCVDVDGGGTADGTPVSLFSCHGADNQRWQLELTPGPQRLVGVAGKCLIPGPVDDDGNTRMVIGDCAGPEALWQLDTPGSSSPSLLVHQQSGMCLDVLDSSTADSTPITLFDCHGNANQVWRPAPEICTRDALGLCLQSERFRVDLEWHSFDGTTGSGKAVPVGSDDSGLMWFFSADNWELLIKVLDGCAINDRLWVFAAATTTVEYTLRVTDTQVGVIREYHNDLGNAAAAITDTDAFDTCSAGSASPTAIEEPIAGSVRDGPIRASRTGRSLQGRSLQGTLLKGNCAPSATRMCLADDRFSVEVTWRDQHGNSGSGQVVDVGSPDSGLLWFFNSSNWEMLVKVLDACHLQDPRFLMLAAATTDVEYTLRVTDTESGLFREYFNSQGNAAAALVDSFATCP